MGLKIARFSIFCRAVCTRHEKTTMLWPTVPFGGESNCCGHCVDRTGRRLEGGVGWGGVNEAGRKEIFGLDISFGNTMAKNNHIKIDLR